MLTIRLQRVGRKNDPSFRVILVESKRAAKTGSFKEVLGSYDARTDRVDLKTDRIKHWLSMGTTVSDTVHNMLISQKVIEGKKINVLPRKSPPKKEGEAAAPVNTDVAAETPAAVQ
jgi:small subunit ribosomal protein S16